MDSTVSSLYSVPPPFQPFFLISARKTPRPHPISRMRPFSIYFSILRLRSCLEIVIAVSTTPTKRFPLSARYDPEEYKDDNSVDEGNGLVKATLHILQ